MEGKKVQGAVRHKDQMFGVEVFADGSNEFRVERFQMTLGRREQGLLEAVSISSAHAKFRKLKAEQVKKVHNARDYADGGDFQRFACDHNGYKPIARGVILDQRGVRGQSGLQASQREVRGSFESGVFALIRGQFPERSQELVFVRNRFFVQLLQAFRRAFFRAQLFQLDAVVIPV